MRKMFALVFLAMSAVAFAAPEEFLLASADGEEAIMYWYPSENSAGVAVVCCPGGAYAGHAIGHEGHDFAPWLNSQGIDFAVVKYRLPKQRHALPATDARAAIRKVRELSGDKQVGIMGFSAGGHLASTVATHFVDSLSYPDFQVLFYPVITMDEGFTHGGTRHNLLGDNPSAELVELYSNELQINPATPPALIFHSSNDDAVPVENVLRYYRAIVDKGVEAEMHLFPIGGHGWGFYDSFEYKPQWQASMAKWLENRK